MSYQLGIDVGTTFTAAAVRRSELTEGEVVQLDWLSASVPSVVFVPAEGPWVVGAAAERRALTDPDRVVREFKRRLGDETPLWIGGQRVPAQAVFAGVVRWVVDEVSRREGEAPSRVVLTHPVGWGPHKRELVAEALAQVGLAEVTLLAEPVAAAHCYASSTRLASGAAMAVYDLGGGTFDAALVGKSGPGQFEILGRPEGIEYLGGLDFDELIFEQVREAIGQPLEEVDTEDQVVLAGLARLRRECTEAKEALSADTEVTIPVMVPGAGGQVRLVRSEFEALICPAIDETIEAIRRTMSSAGYAEQDLSAVLLVGGSSRIPLVSEMLSAQLGQPVAADTDPKTTVALGAALVEAPDAVADFDTMVAGLAADPAVDMDEPERPDTQVGDPDYTLPRSEAERRRRRGAFALAGAVSVVAVVALASSVSEIPVISSLGSSSSGGNRVAAAETPSSTKAGQKTDPWTGEPVTGEDEPVTSLPGPVRPGAKATDEDPAPDSTRIGGDDKDNPTGRSNKTSVDPPPEPDPTVTATGTPDPDPTVTATDTPDPTVTGDPDPTMGEDTPQPQESTPQEEGGSATPSA